MKQYWLEYLNEDERRLIIEALTEMTNQQRYATNDHDRGTAGMLCASLERDADYEEIT